MVCYLFLSTLPARGATRTASRTKLTGRISIHAPREGSDDHVLVTDAGGEGISIHAPREGSDTPVSHWTSVEWIFLSTLPARGATSNLLFYPYYIRISIHAPREGSDPPSGTTTGTPDGWISIHAPREGSDTSPSPSHPATSNFYPRSPRGERPEFLWVMSKTKSISIHAPREGSDSKCAEK